MKRFQLILFSTIKWDFLWQRPQALALEFAKHGHRVLYVEPVETLFRERPPSMDAFATKKSRVADGLEILALPAGLPTLKGRPAWLLEKKFESAMKGFHQHLSGDLPIVAMFSYPSNWAKVLRYSGIIPDLLCYDCLDDYQGIVSSEHHGLVLEQQEKELAFEADLIFASAKYLEAKFPEAKTTYVPNAVDDEIIEAPFSPAKEITKIGKPVIGFLGAIWSWIDIELIREAAVAYPEYSFVLIGPVRDIDVSSLDKMANVFILPAIPKEEIASCLDAFDVAIIPYLDIPRMKSVSSVKAFTYLARGLPVVTVDFPEIHSLEKHVFIAGSRSEFIELIGKAVTNDNPEAKKLRIEAARRNSWSNRVDTMLEAIDRGFSQKAGADLEQ